MRVPSLAAAFALLVASRVVAAEEARPRAPVYAGASVEGLGIPLPVRGIGGRGGVLLAPDLALDVGAIHEWGPFVVGNDTASLSATVIDASVVGFPMRGSFFLRGGVAYERVSRAATIHDFEDSYEESFQAVGTTFALGNRWEGSHAFVAIEWVGARIWLPFHDSVRSNFAYGGAGAVEVDLRLLTVTLGLGL